MSEYAERYIDLGHFALKVMKSESKKAMRFEKGLRLELYHQVVVFALPTYQAVLEKTQLVETLHREHVEYNNRLPNHRQLPPLLSRTKKRQRTVRDLTLGHQILLRNTKCTRCSRSHGDRPCPVTSRGCYRCGSNQHLMCDCPMPKEPNRLMVPGRMFTLTTQRQPQRLFKVYFIFLISPLES